MKKIKLLLFFVLIFLLSACGPTKMSNFSIPALPQAYVNDYYGYKVTLLKFEVYKDKGCYRCKYQIKMDYSQKNNRQVEIGYRIKESSGTVVTDGYIRTALLNEGEIYEGSEILFVEKSDSHRNYIVELGR